MEFKFRTTPVYRSCLLFTITLTSTAHRPQSLNRLQSPKVLWRSLFMIFHRPITAPLQHFSCDIQNTGCWLIHSENIEDTRQQPDRPGLNFICITTAAGAGSGVDKKFSRRDPCQEPYTNLSLAQTSATQTFLVIVSCPSSIANICHV